MGPEETKLRERLARKVREEGLLDVKFAIDLEALGASGVDLQSLDNPPVTGQTKSTLTGFVMVPETRFEKYSGILALYRYLFERKQAGREIKRLRATHTILETEKFPKVQLTSFGDGEITPLQFLIQLAAAIDDHLPGELYQFDTTCAWIVWALNTDGEEPREG